MPDRWYFDWVTFWVLGGLVLWEGVRRVPAGAYLLRNAVGYPWHVAGGPFAAAGWRLASWMSPLVCHVLLVPGAGDGRTPHRHLRRWTAVLRIPGAAALVALVVGVPLLTASVGFMGLLQALGAAFGASLLAVLLSVLALRRMGVGLGTAIRDALPLLSPFAAPRAPEIVLARGLEGVGLVEALRWLLPPDAYAEWVRPVAYDLARGAGGLAMEGLLPAGEAAAILRQPPPGLSGDEAYCPRCGRAYLPTATACRVCGGVQVVAAGGAG